jgi:cytochrome c oxidase subunit 1
VKALPWDNPVMLAVTFSFVMLGFGGAGGIINMSYQLNESIHNTQWVTGHFHLIFGGAIVIMYLAIAYDLWPQACAMRAAAERSHEDAAVALVRGHDGAIDAVASRRIAWHAATDGVLRLLGPRAAAAGLDRNGFDDRGLVLVVSAALFVFILARARSNAVTPPAFAFSRSAYSSERTPAALNTFGLWVAMMMGSRSSTTVIRSHSSRC